MNVILPTSGFHGHSVKFSPWDGSLFACAAGQNFGISGKGVLLIGDHQIPAAPVARVRREFHWPHDAIYDLTWSEVHPSIIWSCSADGSIQIWAIDAEQVPIAHFKGHDAEVSSLDWNCVREDPPLVLSASWDSSIRLWDGSGQTDTSGQAPISTMLTGLEGGNVYQAVWSPLRRRTFASAHQDGCGRIWDHNVDPIKPVLILEHSHDPSSSEVLTCDWCKYDLNQIITGTTDGLIWIWDLRSARLPLHSFPAHEAAVKRVRCSPHDRHGFGSVSYDRTTRLWNCDNTLSSPSLPSISRPPMAPPPPQIPHRIFAHHSEFVHGLDYNNSQPHLIADCSWDQTVRIFSEI